MKIVVTGARGFIGRHVCVHLHALDCAARFAGRPPGIEWTALDREAFADRDRLRTALRGADAVIHLAARIRGTDAEVAEDNAAISERLIDGCRDAGARPRIVHASSTHRDRPTAYGRAKAAVSETLQRAGLKVTDMILPHVFGEGARPRYNNVTATLIDCLIAGRRPRLDPGGEVSLVHAGQVAERAIRLALRPRPGAVPVRGKALTVEALHDRLWEIHERRQAGAFPPLRTRLDAALFRAYRAAEPPHCARHPLQLRRDARGDLFEAAPGAATGHVFLSWTEPGATRGDHFHLHKIERFVVLQGRAEITWRPALGGPVTRVRAEGDLPEAIDIPPLTTHAITNLGDEPMLAAFWCHTRFDPARPDTYADPVVHAPSTEKERAA